jgi:hypothetical protein
MLGYNTIGNSRLKTVNPLAVLEACLPDTSSAPRRPSTYANGAETWQVHHKL